MDTTVQLIFVLGLVVVAVLIVGLLVVRNFGRRILVRLPVPHRMVELYDLFEEGMFAVDRRSLPVILIVTGAIWTTEALRLLFVIESMPFDVMVGVSGAFFVALIASLLTAVPFTPAGLGLVELGMAGILTRVYDVAPEEAAAIVIVDRAISVLSVIIVGGLAYVFSSKTRGDPAITTGGDSDPGTGAVRTTPAGPRRRGAPLAAATTGDRHAPGHGTTDPWAGPVVRGEVCRDGVASATRVGLSCA